MHSVYLSPALFSPTPTQHFLHTIHSRLKRWREQLRLGELQCCVLSVKMVGKFYEIVDNYEKRLKEMPFIPRGSFRRRMLRQDGGPNRDFLTYLFCDSGLAMHFLKDVCLLRSKVQCNTCGQDMTWSAELSIPGFRWRCPRKVAGVKCSASRSIRTGSWFQQSRLTFREVLLVTYGIVCR